MIGRIDVIYARFSSELQRIESNADQERRCRDRLDQLKISHAHFQVIADEAERGDSEDRPGFNKLKELIYSGRLGTLVVTSSLASPAATPSRRREGHRLPWWPVPHRHRGYRHLRKGLGDESGLFGDAPRAGQPGYGRPRARGMEGRVLDGNGSAGDFPTAMHPSTPTRRRAELSGARAETQEGGPDLRGGRQGRTRDLRSVHYGNSISQVVQWLNSIRHQIPRVGYRNSQGLWHHQHVRKMLANSKYIGIWPYGRTTVVRNSRGNKKQVALFPYQKVVIAQRPGLRIVDQATWDAAQAKLRELNAIYGLRPGRRKRGPSEYYKLLYANKLLPGLVHCHLCDSRLHIFSEKDGKHMGCPKHRAGTCAMTTRVKYVEAEAAVMGVFQQMLSNWPEWLRKAATEMQAAIQQAAHAVPEKVTSAQSQLAQVEKAIGNLVDTLASGVNSPAIRARLTDLENEKLKLTEELNALHKLQTTEVSLPDDVWIAQQLADIGALLEENSRDGIRLLRSIIGKIVAEEVKVPGRIRGYIRLHFRIDGWAMLVQVLSKKLPASLLGAIKPVDRGGVASDEFVIELGDRRRWIVGGRRLYAGVLRA